MSDQASCKNDLLACSRLLTVKPAKPQFPDIFALTQLLVSVYTAASELAEKEISAKKEQGRGVVKKIEAIHQALNQYTFLENPLTDSKFSELLSELPLEQASSLVAAPATISESLRHRLEQYQAIRVNLADINENIRKVRQERQDLLAQHKDLALALGQSDFAGDHEELSNTLRGMRKHAETLQINIEQQMLQLQIIENNANSYQAQLATLGFVVSKSSAANTTKADKKQSSAPKIASNAELIAGLSNNRYASFKEQCKQMTVPTLLAEIEKYRAKSDSKLAAATDPHLMDKLEILQAEFESRFETQASASAAVVKK